MNPITYLALHPISEAPPKDGVYWMLGEKAQQLYQNTSIARKWQTQVVPVVEFYGDLEPITGVLVSEMDAIRLGYLFDKLESTIDPASDTMLLVNQLINSLTNKAK